MKDLPLDRLLLEERALRAFEEDRLVVLVAARSLEDRLRTAFFFLAVGAFLATRVTPGFLLLTVFFFAGALNAEPAASSSDTKSAKRRVEVKSFISKPKNLKAILHSSLASQDFPSDGLRIPKHPVQHFTLGMFSSILRHKSFKVKRPSSRHRS
jgi:hypothetical protein